MVRAPAPKSVRIQAVWPESGGLDSLNELFWDGDNSLTSLDVEGIKCQGAGGLDH